jgi:V8-like Glu-specific endopeptidase
MLLRALPLCCLLLAPCLAVSEQQRQEWRAGDPAWLRAVGRLEVPGYIVEDGERLHNRETCTATLIAPRRILTAWHCLEYYHDLSRPIRFSLPGQASKPREARRLVDGAGMAGDWALLALDRPVPASEATPLAIARQAPAMPGSLSFAGYGGGRDNALLSWQARCRAETGDATSIRTLCDARRGDSGGPGIVNGEIIGVISKGSGQGLTFLVPAGAFARQAEDYLD